MRVLCRNLIVLHFQRETLTKHHNRAEDSGLNRWYNSNRAQDTHIPGGTSPVRWSCNTVFPSCDTAIAKSLHIHKNLGFHGQNTSSNNHRHHAWIAIKMLPAGNPKGSIKYIS